MVDTRRLVEALREWGSGSCGALVGALGYEPVGMSVPRAALEDFGLDPEEPAVLEVAARSGSFTVFRIIFSGGLDADAIRRVAGALYQHNPARRALLLLEAQHDSGIVFASWGLGPGPFRLQKLWIDPAAPRRSELDILAGLGVNGASTATELAFQHARALDRELVTRRFFDEFRLQRADLAAAMTGVPLGAEGDRLDLSLILLSRLLFIYFIQRRGWLAGDKDYLRHLYESALRKRVPFFRRRLKPLFFSALNRPPESRTKIAADLGQLPYLNGGLFERDALERQHPRLDVPDDCFAQIFEDLLDKYQFTLSEDQPADQDVAVDPEMLGKVFEGLMSASARGTTGAFFTPRALVDRLVEDAVATHLSRAAGCDPQLIESLWDGEAPKLDDSLRALLAERVRSIRILDPAVGSGAFLLSALHHLERLQDGLEGRPDDPFTRFERRKQIIQHNLYGVDVNGAAVRLCELRLWLALVVGLEVESISDIPPLPNLDLKIRQGDALVDPLDFLLQLGALDNRNLAARWSRTISRLHKRRQRYFRAIGPAKRRVGRSLRKAERDLALNFLGELSQQIDARRRDLRVAESSRDLFGRRSGLSRSQRRALLMLERRRKEIGRLVGRIAEHEELPFFSFPVHFADPEHPSRGFDVTVGNPPWVRAHRWSRLSRARLKERFQFLRNAGWQAGGRLAGAGRGFGAQLDLSALFVERSLELLADDGALAYLLPAKLIRALYAGALRDRLLRSTRLIRLEDRALASNPAFDATTYPLVLLLTKHQPDVNHTVRIRLHKREGEPADFRLLQSELPLLSDDGEAPWVLAPTAVRAVLDRMRASGPPLGAQPGRRPSRGIFTGANSVFLGVVRGEPGDDGRVAVRFPGSTVSLEAECIRPALRGEDLAPWEFALGTDLIWTHSDDGMVLPKLPSAITTYLASHDRQLRARRELRPGQLPWTLFRARPEKWTLRVAWRDIALSPSAVVIPATVPFLASTAPIVSLNTVYQIPADTEDQAHFLAAVLNSSVACSFLKAIAERASGGYFRFLGWTVALLPLPITPDPTLVAECVRLSRSAHARGGITPTERESLDWAVGRLYGLKPAEVKTLQAFDAELTGRATVP